MLVKKEEWDDLVNAKDILEKDYNSKLEIKQKRIKELENEIFRLQKSLKPDEIELQLFYYVIDGNSSWRSQERLQWQIKLPQTINLSMGITNQVLKLLKQVSTKIEEEFEKKRAVDLLELKNSNKTRYNWFHDRLKTLPSILSRKRVIKFFEYHYIKE